MFTIILWIVLAIIVCIILCYLFGIDAVELVLELLFAILSIGGD